jgi:hypothetical protein
VPELVRLGAVSTKAAIKVLRCWTCAVPSALIHISDGKLHDLNVRHLTRRQYSPGEDFVDPDFVDQVSSATKNPKNSNAQHRPLKRYAAALG